MSAVCRMFGVGISDGLNYAVEFVSVLAGESSGRLQFSRHASGGRALRVSARGRVAVNAAQIFQLSVADVPEVAAAKPYDRKEDRDLYANALAADRLAEIEAAYPGYGALANEKWVQLGGVTDPVAIQLRLRKMTPMAAGDGHSMYGVTRIVVSVRKDAPADPLPMACDAEWRRCLVAPAGGAPDATKTDDATKTNTAPPRPEPSSEKAKILYI